MRKGKWGLEEDALLRMGVNDFGRCWIRIAETIPGRTQVKIYKSITLLSLYSLPLLTRFLFIEAMSYTLDANKVQRRSPTKIRTKA